MNTLVKSVSFARQTVWAALLCAAVAFPAGVAAQDARPARPTRTGPITSVLVTDLENRPIPYAIVTVGNSPARVADANGVAQLPAPVDSDSVRMVVRRIGYNPSGEWAQLDPEGAMFAVKLAALPRALNPTTILARRDTPLARRGFYDRLERVSRGATVGRFITPEELDQRNVSQISSLLAGEPYIRIQRTNGKPILTGRQVGCGFQVVLDGMRMSGTVEEIYTDDGQEEVRRLGGGAQGTQRFINSRQSIDELISALSIAALEIYPSAAGAPPEIQRAAGTEACGIIAIWSGDRR
jgi:hypothetical protein